MKVAVISDIHGNWRALEAVLDDIARDGVDQIICAGDVINPFLRSREVWLKLKELGIPVLRGNHEDYIVSYFTPGDRPEIRESIQFQPTRIVAEHLGAEIATEFKALPLDTTVPGPDGNDLYVCHASPEHNARSYIRGVDETMEVAFKAVEARTVVAGHIHSQWQGRWQDKHLIIAGSVGLAHNGVPLAEYAMMIYNKGEWFAELRAIRYDTYGTLKEFRETGLLERGGPVAWMLYDELLSGRPRLAEFLPRIFTGLIAKPTTLLSWEKAIEGYLREIGRWNYLKAVLRRS